MKTKSLAEELCGVDNVSWLRLHSPDGQNAYPNTNLCQTLWFITKLGEWRDIARSLESNVCDVDEPLLSDDLDKCQRRLLRRGQIQISKALIVRWLWRWRGRAVKLEAQQPENIKRAQEHMVAKADEMWRKCCPQNDEKSD